jgi:hypothetical protein
MTTSGLATSKLRSVDTCFCYAIDEGYLLPSLVSASMLRRHIDPDKADIVIICFGPTTDLTRVAAAVSAAEGIVFLSAPTEVLQGLPMNCARFLLDHILDPAYADVTYLDADTQVLGSVRPLLACAIPAGGLVAVRDLMALMSDDPAAIWQKQRDYFLSIGIAKGNHSSYFNSGVLRFRRSEWAGISRDCIALCRSSAGRAFKFADQDALNVVLAGRTSLASLKWNFPGFFLGRGIEDIAAPKIVHYMSKPRPWDGPFQPWGNAGMDPYIAFCSRYPGLAGLHRPMTGIKRLRYVAQQAYKRVSFDWGSKAMRARIARFEANAIA